MSTWLWTWIGLMSAPALAARVPAELEGTWSGVITTPQHAYWQAEDHICFAGCTPEAYAFLTQLLADPASDAQPVEALLGAAIGFMRQQLAQISTPAGLAAQEASRPENDPTLDCKPYGFVREALNPLPMVMRQDGDNLVIEYEEWTQKRTIYIDGRAHPTNLEPTPLGHSIGRYEGGALIVETVALSADIYTSFLSGGAYSDQARAVERYTVEDNPHRLIVELTIEDPVMLRAPYRLTKTWLATPDVELVLDSCGDTPGQP